MSSISFQSAPHTSGGVDRLWHRELSSYPSLGRRIGYLGIIVLTTCLFYYQFYVLSSVSSSVLKDTGMSFMYFVSVNVIALVLSALTSVAAGVTDRVGRANIIVAGVFACALVCMFGLANAHSAGAVLGWYAVLGALEGIVLVATPALVRDFSPQLGRASAMGFWTIGPVAGSLVATAVVSHVHRGAWQDQYLIAGTAGLVVFVIAFFWLRELSPALRDQIMVSEKDRAVLEARARGIDVEAALSHPIRTMLRPRIVGSALAISLFLFIYFAAVSFFPLYFQTLFGYSESRANSVLAWMWAFQAGALIVIGVVSDRLRVRKPFMVVGGIAAIVMTLILINLTGHPDTSYGTFALVLTLLATSLGMAFAPWMASYTETVEEENPALTATGLSVWGLVIRSVAALAVFLGPQVMTTVTTLVNDGPKAAELAAAYAPQLATAAKIAPATQAALAANPADPATEATAVSQVSGVSIPDVAKTMQLGTQYAAEMTTAQAISPATQAALLMNPADTAAQAAAVQEIMAGLKVAPGVAAADLVALAQVPTQDLVFMATTAPKVQTAAGELTALATVPTADLATMKHVKAAAEQSPAQWKKYLWIAVAGEVLFLPLIFLMAGFWSPRRAREAARAHAEMIEAESRRLR